MKIQTITNVSNPAVECDRMFLKPTASDRKKDKSRYIGVSPETLSRYGRAWLLPTNTKGLNKVTRILTGLKHAPVFQLRWLLGRLFKLLIKLCEALLDMKGLFMSSASAGSK